MTSKINTDNSLNLQNDFQPYTFSWLIFNILKLCGIDFSKQNVKPIPVRKTNIIDNDLDVSKTITKVKRKKKSKDYSPPFGKDTVNFIINHKQIVSLVTVLIFMFVIYPHTPVLKTAILMIVFIGIAAISRIWIKLIPVQSFGIEFVLLFTIISGRLFGPAIGVIVGVTSMVLSAMIADDEPMKLWPAFIAIAIVGNYSGTLAITSISTLGIVLTVVYDLIVSIIYYFLGSSVAKIILFDVTHIIWNYYVFYTIAPWILMVVV